MSDLVLAFEDALRRFHAQKTADELDSQRTLLTPLCDALAEERPRQLEPLVETALQAISKHSEIADRHVVAGYLLRILAEPSCTWLTEQPWRPKVLALLLAEHEQTLFNLPQLRNKTQGHEQIAAIRSLVLDLKSRVSSAVAELTSLSRLSTHRERLLAAVNGKPGAFVIKPFLPQEALAHLQELYERASIYIQTREQPEVIDAFHSFEEQANRSRLALHGQAGEYITLLGDDVIERLINLVNQDFSTNKAIQPASLTATPVVKTYPFHVANAVLSFRVQIRNEGPGFAHEVQIRAVAPDNILLSDDATHVGRLPPNASHVVTVRANVAVPSSDSATVLLEMAWRHFDGKARSLQIEIIAAPQRTDIDWTQLEDSDPYSLEPVTSATNLVGRGEILRRITATATGASVGSSLVHGQKRVGKTSIGIVLKESLEKRGYHVTYLEGGNYIDPNAEETIARLGRRLCRNLVAQDAVSRHAEIPSFSNALSPLADFIEDYVSPKSPVVFILDEFDELPPDLYGRNPIGNAFFLTLRSLTSLPNVGFVLIGAERMSQILETQADKLNKWDVVQVDYFHREHDWADYEELVRLPGRQWLEFGNDAIQTLHAYTAGNPYLTKLLCREICKLAIDRRDCFVTSAEVESAVKAVVVNAERNTFQHFWEDGMTDTGTEAGSKSVRRRRVLIAVSDALRSSDPAPLSEIEKSPLVRDMVMRLSSDLKEFVARKVLVMHEHDEGYMFKVPLFREWLNLRGVHDIILTFSETDQALRERDLEETLRVSSKEVVELAGSWPSYRGQRISEDRIRAWLEQFGKIRAQRAMFKLLCGLRFYSNSFIRDKMKEVHGIVARKTQLDRDSSIISYLDGPGKSGADVARLFCDELGLPPELIVEREQLAERIEQHRGISRVLFFDDFVGTGRSASESLKWLDKELRGPLQEREGLVCFVAVVAFLEGYSRVQQQVERMSLPAKVHACDVLDETAQCFADRSKIFFDPEERDYAYALVMEKGKSLEKSPLGYGGNGLAVVFERGCPNNTLPILRVSKKGWTPLFPRH
jgi:hypothetical protein